MDFEKAVKNAKWFAVGILIIVLILFAFRLYSDSLNIISMTIGIAQIAVIIGTIKGFSDKKRYGAICGIILSILLIMSLDIISIIFGILYLIDCIKIENYMRTNQM